MVAGKVPVMVAAIFVPLVALVLVIVLISRVNDVDARPSVPTGPNAAAVQLQATPVVILQSTFLD